MDRQDRKPSWLKTKLGGDGSFVQTKNLVRSHRLNTICASGKCPNMNECWSRGVATFMICGDICTRSCRFCNTITGRPLPLDDGEPERVAESIALMGLRHAVITSVDRDDLKDLGADHWAKTITAIRKRNKDIRVEVLIPDFAGRTELIDIVADAGPDIIAHNMETVRRLTPAVRSAAKYDLSLDVLRHISTRAMSKTGIMAGLGETDEEVCRLMDDVREAGVSMISIGQYLRPSKNNLPVAEYIVPETFERWKRIALDKGFTVVESAPLVRSSYHAEQSLAGAVLNLK